MCVSYDGTWHYLRRLTDEEIVQQVTGCGHMITSTYVYIRKLVMNTKVCSTAPFASFPDRTDNDFWKDDYHPVSVSTLVYTLHTHDKN